MNLNNKEQMAEQNQRFESAVGKYIRVNIYEYIIMPEEQMTKILKNASLGKPKVISDLIDFAVYV